MKSFIEASQEPNVQPQLKDFAKELGISNEIQGQDTLEKEFYAFSCVKAMKEKE